MKDVPTGELLKSKFVTYEGKRYYASKNYSLKKKTFFKVKNKYYYAKKDCAIARKAFKYKGRTVKPNKKTGAISVKAYKKLKKNTRTFIRVDISSQSIVFYKNGKVKVRGSVVTGKNSTPTPTGTYKIRSKAKNVHLIGDDYDVLVHFWMPFIGNSYGLHDAPWRSAFGGHIYPAGGSHGCINLPYNVAAKIYKYAPVGTKLIVRK